MSLDHVMVSPQSLIVLSFWHSISAPFHGLLLHDLIVTIKWSASFQSWAFVFFSVPYLIYLPLVQQGHQMMTAQMTVFFFKQDLNLTPSCNHFGMSTSVSRCLRSDQSIGKHCVFVISMLCNHFPNLSVQLKVCLLIVVFDVSFIQREKNTVSWTFLRDSVLLHNGHLARWLKWLLQNVWKVFSYVFCITWVGFKWSVQPLYHIASAHWPIGARCAKYRHLFGARNEQFWSCFLATILNKNMI